MKTMYIRSTEIDNTAIDTMEKIMYDFQYPQLGCSWIMTTEGDPITDCDDVDADLIEKVEALIADEKHHDVTVGDEADLAYVEGLIEAWGL